LPGILNGTDTEVCLFGNKGEYECYGESSEERKKQVSPRLWRRRRKRQFRLGHA